MYYSHQCTYCNKVFYTFNDNKWQAAKILYNGIKKHLIEYGEDDKEYEMDDYEEKEDNQMYNEMKESNEAPLGGYQVD